MLELYIKIFIEKQDTFATFMAYFGHVINGSGNIIFYQKALTIFGRSRKNQLLCMSKTRTVSLGCKMRLGKGKFKCMHI